MSKTIIVNASAMRKEDEFNYLVFVHKSVSGLIVPANVRIVYVDKTSWFDRILWDSYGNYFLKNENNI